MRPKVGIIANPVSARDIRRVIANATSLQITDRANIVLRVLAALKATGVEEVLMMPERGGIWTHVERGLKRARNLGDRGFPSVSHVDIPIRGTVDDTRRAAQAMASAGVGAIVVLGGDGTHRAVAGVCGRIPIAGISTGTNNAFPEHREPTITGLATGLAAMGRVPASVAFRSNKRIEVSVNGGEAREIALVDVALVSDAYVGARALWRTETFRELYLTFADPEVIGMSAIGGLVEPVGREAPGGLALRLASADGAARVVFAPIAPGTVSAVGIESVRRMPQGEVFTPALTAGSIALDGERELAFSERDRLEIRLEEDAFLTVNVGGVMQHAGGQGLMAGSAARLKAAE